MAKFRAVFLMSRLSDYMLNCLVAWSDGSNVEILAFCKAADRAEAPFEFDLSRGKITFVDIDSISDETVATRVETFAPDLIVCFGWMNNAYLKLVRKRKEHTTAVMTMDTQWHGSLRQHLGVLWGNIVLSRLFDFVWVPGEPQRRFARKLRFSEAQIHEGLYVANKSRFVRGNDNVARRFVFVGRYVEIKGMWDLWKAFDKFHNERLRIDGSPSDWELHCIGTGPLFQVRPNHPSIRHLGFVQPKSLAVELDAGGVFVMPSHHEPWGVVVQELASAGYPLLVSDRVGAAAAFVTGENGRVFPSQDPEALKALMHNVADLPDEARVAMGRASRRIAGSISVDQWCATANRFLTHRLDSTSKKLRSV